MKRLIRLVVVAVAMTLVGGVLPAAPSAVAQGDDTQPIAMVSGAWRLTAWQLATGPAFPEQGLEARDGVNWGVLIADVTNTGAGGALPLADIGFGGVAADPAESARVSASLGFTALAADGSITLAENGIGRVAVVFSYDGDLQKATLAFAEQTMPAEQVRADALDIAALPEAPSAMQLEMASIAATPSASTLSVMLPAGETRDVAMNSVQAPPADGCYGAEAIAHVTAVSGGTVWVETVPGVASPSVWVDDPANAKFTLLDLSLVFAGAADADGTGIYGPWLSGIADQIEDQKVGLWANCRGANGQYINPPTPTPVPTPSAEEIRAQYTWVDNRELITRPFQYEGQKIAVSGEVFTLDVDQSGTGLQIWVETPTGREAVVVVLIGDQTPGLYEGMWVTVYGTGAGTFTGTNGFGAQITQPLIRADFIDY